MDLFSTNYISFFIAYLSIVVVITIVVACCMAARLCCFQDNAERKPRRKKIKVKKGVDEGLQAVLKLAIYNKLQEDAEERLPINVKAVNQQQNTFYHEAQPHFAPIRWPHSAPIRNPSEADNESISNLSDVSSLSPETSTRCAATADEQDGEEDTNDTDDPYQLKLSYYYSKDTLVLTLHQLSGVPNKSSGGYDHVRMSIALLPEEHHHHSQYTRSLFVPTTQHPLLLGEMFRFFDVDRATVMKSFLRFRLFADISSELECCVGEMVVGLSGLEHNVDGVGLSKDFQRKQLIRTKTDVEVSDDENDLHQ